MVSADVVCGACGTPITADQRYCLACGTRLAPRRVDLDAILGPATSALPAAARGRTGMSAARRAAALGITGALAIGTVAGAALAPAPASTIAASPPGIQVVLPPAAAQPADPDAGVSPQPLDGIAIAPEPSFPSFEEAPLEPVLDSVPPSPGPAPAVAPAPDLAPEARAEDPGDEPLPPLAPEDEVPAARFDKVFVIVLSEVSYDGLYGPESGAEYLRTKLRPKGTLLSNYQAVTARGRAANGIALVSGQRPNPATQDDCTTYSKVRPGKVDFDTGRTSGTGCVYPAEVSTVGDVLEANGLTWKAYVEDQAAGGPEAGTTCRRPAADAQDTTLTPRPGDAYATARNPWVYFAGLIDLESCQKNDVDLSELAVDLRKPADKAPALSYIVPSRCRDGSPTACPGEEISSPDEGIDQVAGATVAADEFLAEWVPRILKSKAFAQRGLLLVVTDVPSAPEGGGKEKLRVGALAVGDGIRPRGTSPELYDHYDLLRTLFDGYGLAPLPTVAKARPFGEDVLAPLSERR